MTQYHKTGVFRQAGTVPGQKKIGTVLFFVPEKSAKRQEMISQTGQRKDEKKE